MIQAIKTQIQKVGETYTIVSAASDNKVTASVFFFDGEYEVEMKGWADKFYYATEAKAISRAKEMVRNGVLENKYK